MDGGDHPIIVPDCQLSKYPFSHTLKIVGNVAHEAVIYEKIKIVECHCGVSVHIYLYLYFILDGIPYGQYYFKWPSY